MRKPIGLTAPYRPKTVLVPGAPWPKAEEPKPKPKKAYVPKPPTGSKRANTDKKFDEWLAKGQA